MAKYNIHSTARIGSLGEKQINAIAGELTEMTLENDLRRQLQDNIKRLRDMGTYRGRRHAMSLPVRGQRTRTQVSFGCVELATWTLELADKDMADHDREEVQPRGEARLEGSLTPVIFFPCLFFFTPCISPAVGARIGYTTVKIPNVQQKHSQTKPASSVRSPDAL